LYKLRGELEQAGYNVYEFPTIDLADMVVDENEEKLLRIGEIFHHYADCRGADWSGLLDRLREAINYEFKRGVDEIESIVQLCETIEAERQHAKTVLASEACPSAEEMRCLFCLSKPVVILMNEGLFTTCSLMLGLCHLCPMKPGMQPEQRVVWQNIMENARSNARQLIMSMLEALRSCTTELDVHGAMFGLTVGEETLLNTLVGLICLLLAGNSTNDHPRGDKDVYLHASMRAARAGLCLKDLAGVATADSAGVDVMAVGIEQVTPSHADEEDKERIELFHQVDPLYFDTVLLQKGAEYRVYTGLLSDISPKWSLFVMP
jgi:hypothetical protein